jgi:hypothetical protein
MKTTSFFRRLLPALILIAFPLVVVANETSDRPTKRAF